MEYSPRDHSAVWGLPECAALHLSSFLPRSEGTRSATPALHHLGIFSTSRHHQLSSKCNSPFTEDIEARARFLAHIIYNCSYSLFSSDRSGQQDLGPVGFLLLLEKMMILLISGEGGREENKLEIKLMYLWFSASIGVANFLLNIFFKIN